MRSTSSARTSDLLFLGVLAAAMSCRDSALGLDRSASDSAAGASPPAPTSTAASGTSSASSSSALPIPPAPGWHREMLGRTFAHHASLDRVDKETKPLLNFEGAIRTAQDFQFVLGQGSGRDGYATVAVEGNGRTVVDFPAKDGSFHRAELTLPKDEVDALRRELIGVSFATLARGYYADVSDGTQWFVRVRAGGARKGVFLDNHFPAQITRLAEYVRARIIEPRRAEIERAGSRPIGTLGEPEFWPEDIPK